MSIILRYGLRIKTFETMNGLTTKKVPRGAIIGLIFVSFFPILGAIALVVTLIILPLNFILGSERFIWTESKLGKWLSS